MLVLSALLYYREGSGHGLTFVWERVELSPSSDQRRFEYRLTDLEIPINL